MVRGWITELSNNPLGRCQWETEKYLKATYCEIPSDGRGHAGRFGHLTVIATHAGRRHWHRGGIRWNLQDLVPYRKHRKPCISFWTYYPRDNLRNPFLTVAFISPSGNFAFFVLFTFNKLCTCPVPDGQLHQNVFLLFGSYGRFYSRLTWKMFSMKDGHPSGLVRDIILFWM